MKKRITVVKNQQKPRPRFWRRAGRALLILLLILFLVSTLTNVLLPDRTEDPERLSDVDQARAETLFSESGNDYPWDDPAMTEQAEMNMLVEALKAEENQQQTRLVRDFLTKRSERRQAAGIDSLMIQLEQLREWEEGLAKYTELAIWKTASNSADYQPVEELNNNPAFDHYENFEGQWERELSTIQFQGGAGKCPI